MFEIRTDLAVEEQESCGQGKGAPEGVTTREWRGASENIRLTEVRIRNRQGAEAMGKPEGTYVTIEAGELKYQDRDYHRKVSGELAGQLKQMVEGLRKKHILSGGGPRILAVGLGNPSVTPDALGPMVLGNLRVNRKAGREEDPHGPGDGSAVLSGIVPGVMAQTGMETAEIVNGIVRETKPDMIIAIDALAARSIRRLGTTIQLTDTGIHPGSGVGNHRHSLTRKSLGIPVLAIGVPTVVGAAAIVRDTISAMIGALWSHMETKGLGDYLDQLDGEEQYQLIRELLEPEFGSLYVTPPDIDLTVKRLSYTISEGIHMAFYENPQDEGEPFIS